MSLLDELNIDPDWKQHWRGMPEFVQDDATPAGAVKVQFRTLEDRAAFLKQMGYPENWTMSIWNPRREFIRPSSKNAEPTVVKANRHPVYVISKGRWDNLFTAKYLRQLGIPFSLVVEPQELDAYAKVVSKKNILTLPFSNLGKGSIPARNWVWEHSIKAGAERHWILDDNIRGFYRLYRNLKVPVQCGNAFAAAEHFVDRYENVGLAGLNYEFLVPRRKECPAYYLNTRIYSCILIDNSLQFRWRGRYNEDTDLSLRVLKAGLCTVLFNAYLAKKQPTMTMKGGNTDELYRTEAGFDGRKAMAESLQRQHPDCVKITRKWGRWQHQVDYSRFKRNRLKPKKTKSKQTD